MKYNTVIFDLDGTLLDTLEDLTDSVNYILKKYHYSLRTKDEIRSFLGNGIQKLLERSLPKNEKVYNFDQIFQDFNDYYAIHCADKTKLYDGITDLLDRLKQMKIKVAVVSNKGNYAVQDLKSKYLKNQIEIAVGETDKVKRKPAPDMLYHALNQLGSEAKQCIFVGDSEVDIDTAKNANVTCLSVTWGFRTRQFLAEHDATNFVDKPKEIISFLQQE